MYLQKLEIAGFKSFATKTTLEFPRTPQSGLRPGLAVIVGPNGSGKSNVADALRWALGEQSLKLLRGKKSEDVIFSGSAKLARLGLAEVSLHINNEDGTMPVDHPEVVITRRQHRSGESEYLLNKQPIRLADLLVLVARANFGAKSYSVIGQGMVDAILVASPAERKDFFDEAAGIKQYQIKRGQSVRKLQTAWENLKAAEAIIEEVAPRLRTLSRQVRKLEQREAIAAQLADAQRQHYGHQWQQLAGLASQLEPMQTQLQRSLADKTKVLEGVQRELTSLEQQEAKGDGFRTLQAAYQAALEAKEHLRERQLILSNKIEVAKARAVSAKPIPLPVPEIIAALHDLDERYAQLLNELSSVHDSASAKVLAGKAKKLADDLRHLIGRLEKPAVVHEAVADPSLVKELDGLTKQLADAERAVTAASKDVSAYTTSQQQERGKFFELQRKFAAAQAEVNAVTAKLSEARVEAAKLATRREDLEAEIDAKLHDRSWLKGFSVVKGTDAGQLAAEVERLSRQLEFVGGIDPETVAEYTQTKERHDFLVTQATDLRSSIQQLRTAIQELDETIQTQFRDSVRRINSEFERYFRSLFNGGRAKLEVLTVDEKTAEEVAQLETAAEGVAPADTVSPEDQEIAKLLKGKGGPQIVGVEINAMPPGKKVRGIQMLSGGERALTAIALIAAIIASNPSPFVVLDEVDAALDEANSQRFAAIIEELSARTQFIVISHNRATMHKASILYGVTMGSDSASKLLSLKLEEAEVFAPNRSA